jgi:hypothetical protein
MTWTTLKFGKHEGNTLPQVIFSDPDWFFWAVEEGIIKSEKLKREAQDIYRKARSIKIPQKGDQKLVAEYGFSPVDGKFCDLEIVPISQPSHAGSTGTFRKKVIDLGIPREVAKYDKLGCRLLLKQVKAVLFGNESYQITKNRCERFFDNDENFDL